MRSTRTSALAAFIAAGLDGVERELDPGEPIIGRNMYEMTARGGEGAGDRGSSPRRLSEALDEFEADEVVQSALGPELAAEFLQVKRQEWVRYHNTVGRWEVDQYLTLF